MYDGTTTDECGEDVGDNLISGDTISDSWIDGVSDWWVDNHPITVCVGDAATWNNGNIRWDRSYVREECRFARIVWARPARTLCIALYDRLVTNLRYPVYYWSLGLLVVRTAHDPRVFLRMLMAIGLASLCNMLYYLRSERSPDFLYGVLYAYFSFFTLFWILPYAAVTVRARSWLTR